MTALLNAANKFNLARVAKLVASGARDERAFLSDQGSTFCPDDAHTPKILADLVKQGRQVENEDQALFELYEALLLSGHEIPDGSTRRCAVRVIAGADLPRHERAVAMMKLCMAQGMLDWDSSQWAHDIEKEDPKKSFTPMKGRWDLLVDTLAKAALACNLGMLKEVAVLLPEDHRERAMLLVNPARDAIRGGDQACVDFIMGFLSKREWSLMDSLTSSPLVMRAAQAGHSHILHSLLDRGCDINQLSRDGEHNIITAALDAQKPHMVATLLAMGADPNGGKSPGTSSLHMGAYRMFDDAIDALLAAGANPNALERGGMTPLLTAAMVGNAHAARALLAHGAQLECADDRGQTPMNWAVRNDRLEVYEVLRQAGASMDAVDTAGDTPRSMARGRIKAHMECAQMERDTDEPEVRGRIGPRL
jgi:hypothetical protein